MIWEKSEHKFVNTYRRRTSINDGSEANKESVHDKLITQDLFSRLESARASKVLNKKRSYAQVHLELGQSDFLLRTCSTCGVKYAPGEEEDEKNHNAFHQDYTRGIQFKGWRRERVVSVPSTIGGRVVLVLDCDSPAQRNKVKEVVKMMEIELGEGWILHKLCKVYLYISSQRVVGCLVSESIKEAFKVISCSDDEKCPGDNINKKRLKSATLQFGEIILKREVMKRASSAHQPEMSNGDNSGVILCEREATPAVCGVRAIWVTPSNRRKGVASCLLDALRRSFWKGFVLEKSELAFSQPSLAGKALASSYIGTPSFLVYRTDYTSW